MSKWMALCACIMYVRVVRTHGRYVWIQLAGAGGFSEGVCVSLVECRATIIYKSDGPLDVALLQVPTHLPTW